MKLRIVLILSMVAVSLLMLSCISIRTIDVEVTCDKFTENPHNVRNEIEAEIGDVINVKLCSNPSTGFQWDYETTTENILKEQKHDFEAPEEDVPGAPGTDVWTFMANEKGTTQVLMEYSQPWDGGLKEEWKYTLTVTVE